MPAKVSRAGKARQYHNHRANSIDRPVNRCGHKMRKQYGLWALLAGARHGQSARLTQAQHRSQFVMDAVLPTPPEVEYDAKPWGLTTYANVRYVPCLSTSLDIAYDIVILGAPFDTVILSKAVKFECFC